jgi:hypothetical protein
MLSNSMPSRHLSLSLVATSMLTVLAACSSAPPGPRDLLDEHTGVTVTVVSAPMLFVRIGEHSGGSTHDYLELVAVQKDNAGKYTQVLLLYRWSTSMVGVAGPLDKGASRLLIDVDGKVIELSALEQNPIDVSRPKDVFFPLAADVATHAYTADLETMRRLATSHEITVRLSQDFPDTPFVLWRDGRPALKQFVEQFTEGSR